MNIDNLVSQFKDASESSAPGETVTNDEMAEYRSTCERIKRFIEHGAMEIPAGKVDIQNLGWLLDGKSGDSIDPVRAEHVDWPEFPSLPVYLVSPVDVVASTLARLIEDADEHGPLSAGELRLLYQEMVTRGGRHEH